jgi:Fic family protein
VALQLSKQAQLRLPLVYISGFLEANRDLYYGLLYRVSSEGDWISWIRFFLTAIAFQAYDALLRAELLDKLRSTYLDKVQRKRASAMLPKLIDELFTNPAITVARAARIAEMKPPSAGKLIEELERVGILRERTGRKHYRVFVAHEILDVMNADLDPEPRSRPSHPTSPEPAS